MGLGGLGLATANNMSFLNIIYLKLILNARFAAMINPVDYIFFCSDNWYSLLLLAIVAHLLLTVSQPYVVQFPELIDEVVAATGH